jgi:hypothetical protein
MLGLVAGAQASEEPSLLDCLDQVLELIDGGIVNGSVAQHLWLGGAEHYLFGSETARALVALAAVEAQAEDEGLAVDGAVAEMAE